LWVEKRPVGGIKEEGGIMVEAKEVKDRKRKLGRKCRMKRRNRRMEWKHWRMKRGSWRIEMRR
jgi:hypothetical protein